MKRSYDMSRRSISAEQTTENIVDAAEKLMATSAMADITLAAIASHAGVTVQTVLRHMGSREGCLEAVGRRVETRVQGQRGHTPPGDATAAVAELVDHYEAEGVLVLNLLGQEQSAPEAAARAVADGRAFHRAWVVRCFGPLMPNTRQANVDAVVAATDIYIWKLIRLDLGRSRAATEAIINRLVKAALEDS